MYKSMNYVLDIITLLIKDFIDFKSRRLDFMNFID